MPRNSTKWALTTLGGILALAGAVAMWRGWDQVQLERGWSLLISGAVLLVGGFILVSAAAIVGRLDRLIALAQTPPAQAQGVRTPVAPPTRDSAVRDYGEPSPPALVEEPIDPNSPPPLPEATEYAPEEPPAPVPNATPAPAPFAEGIEADAAAVAAQFAAEIAPRFAIRPRFKTAAPPPEPEPAPNEPRKVDTYRSGDLTYVMFSDGSVEVHAPGGAQRYASLAELREHMLQQS